MASVAPLVFEAIQRNNDTAEKSVPSIDLFLMGSILAKLPRDSGGFVLAASLISSLDLGKEGAPSLEALLTAVAARDGNAYVALAALQSSGGLDADVLLDAGAAEVVTSSTKQEVEFIRRAQDSQPEEQHSLPVELLFSLAALARQIAGTANLKGMGSFHAFGRRKASAKGIHNVWGECQRHFFHARQDPLSWSSTL